MNILKLRLYIDRMRACDRHFQQMAWRANNVK